MEIWAEQIANPAKARRFAIPGGSILSYVSNDFIIHPSPGSIRRRLQSDPGRALARVAALSNAKLSLFV